jgi:autophagy-related protein 11
MDIRTSTQEAQKRLQAIDGLYNIHITEYIPEITKFDRYIRETVIYFSDSKLHLTQVLHAKLQAISHFQSMIASVSPTISSLSGALNVQSEALLQLLHVHRMAPAWGATLVEIVRRKTYVNVFLQKAKEMADVLNQFRSQELRKRDTFKAEIFRYIPHGLVNGLDDPPPYCEISVSNTKDSLPNLVLEDVSNFEKLVSTIRSSTNPTTDLANGSDSISKLQATMMKMTPQLEHISVDFERIVAKSGK